LSPVLPVTHIKECGVLGVGRCDVPTPVAQARLLRGTAALHLVRVPDLRFPPDGLLVRAA
ncbi:MAG TPA: hypothetical protein VED47_00020, partial [Burkholderiaceae bacterium]|nr:hypothetical protein [Burkholderiaceae bacterium]